VAQAEKKVIWKVPGGTEHCQSLWAPETQYIQNAWRVRCAVDNWVIKDTGQIDPHIS